MFSGARQPQHARTAVRLLPREEEFFDLFVEVATRSTLAAQHLRELFDAPPDRRIAQMLRDRKSTRLNSSHDQISYAVFCLKKKKRQYNNSNDRLGRTAPETAPKQLYGYEVAKANKCDLRMKACGCSGYSTTILWPRAFPMCSIRV